MRRNTVMTSLADGRLAFSRITAARNARAFQKAIASGASSPADEAPQTSNAGRIYDSQFAVTGVAERQERLKARPFKILDAS